VTLGASQQLDTVPPAVLGDRVYYTIQDNSGGTSLYRQLYSATFSSGGVSAPAAFATDAGRCSVMVRPLYPTLVSTIGTPAYGAVLLAASSNFCQATSAALAYAGATLISLDVSGNATQAGQTPPLAAQLGNPPANSSLALQWVDAGYFFGEPGIAPPIDGPLQSGLPALLELDGLNAAAATTVDIESFIPGTATAPIRLTQNLR
jgi:hypothetical protein